MAPARFISSGNSKNTRWYSSEGGEKTIKSPGGASLKCRFLPPLPLGPTESEILKVGPGICIFTITQSYAYGLMFIHWPFCSVSRKVARSDCLVSLL